MIIFNKYLAAISSNNKATIDNDGGSKFILYCVPPPMTTATT